MLSSFHITFPLPTIHSGIPLGNGLTGLLVWGCGRTLNITLGNAALWDHRGGCHWDSRQNLADISTALKNHDEQTLRDIFACTTSDIVKRPTLLPLGRLVITLPDGTALNDARLDYTTGLVTVSLSDGHTLRIALSSDSQRFAIEGITEHTSVTLLPAWNLFTEESTSFPVSEKKTLAERGFQPPRISPDGFCQPLPDDPSVTVVTQRGNAEIRCAIYRGDDRIPFQDFDAIYKSSAAYFGSFFEKIPLISLPDSPDLERIYYDGAYRYAAATNPSGVVPGLQGPWLEDDHMPPWSGDYHFNINVQMVCAPALKLNTPAHIRKLFELVLSWSDLLHHNAQVFVGDPSGIMLPHAVDDRGTSMGGFWPGSIDHACSAWIAKLMFEYCDIYGDTQFLRDKAYGFMQGVLQVYKKLIVRNDDGTWQMPVSTSPEYGEGTITAWGPNASFQLAALHNLARNLITAARILEIQPDPFCQDVEKYLPDFSAFTDPKKGPEIAVWDNQPLRQSHRHHSHLGGFFPFKTIDPQAPENTTLLKNTLEAWTAAGMGLWTGWCIPWAAIIRLRCGFPDMAAELLRIWRHFFTTKGGASLHDSPIQGLTIFSQKRGEIMQLDGGMAATYAVSEMMLHACNGELRCFFGIPTEKPLQSARFENIPAPGGVTVSAEYSHGKVTYLKLAAARKTTVTLRFPSPQPLFGNTDTLTCPLEPNQIQAWE